MNTLSLVLAAGLFHVQLPGTFHAGEAVAVDGESWLALRREPAGAALLPVAVQVRSVLDPLLDEDDGSKTASEVASPALERPDDVIAYLRGPTLRAGSVDPVEASDLLLVDRVTELPTANGTASLRFVCAPDAAEPRCDLQYAIGDRTQVLAGWTAHREQDGQLTLGNEAQPRLLFAGDLDRDGKLDLLLDVKDHYNVGRIVLMLSGGADGDALLHEVARFEAVGC